MHHRSLGAAASRRGVAQDRGSCASASARSEVLWTIQAAVMPKKRDRSDSGPTRQEGSHPASIVITAKGLPASRGQPRRRRPRTAARLEGCGARAPWAALPKVTSEIRARLTAKPARKERESGKRAATDAHRHW
jgi:hypothetical protein